MKLLQTALATLITVCALNVSAAASAEAQSCKTANGTTLTAEAPADSASAPAKIDCDDKKAPAKVVAKKAQAKAADKLSDQPSGVEAVKAMAAKVAALEKELAAAKSQPGSNLAAASSKVGHLENGQEYCDAVGNCIRRTTVGPKICENQINGKTIEWDFAPAEYTEEQARSYCRLSGDKFQAKHRGVTLERATPTAPAATPVAAVSVGTIGEVVYSTPASADGFPYVSGSFYCPLKLNGKLFKEVNVRDDAECKSWIEGTAKMNGWVPAK